MNSEKSYDSLPNFTAADCEFVFLFLCSFPLCFLFLLQCRSHFTGVCEQLLCMCFQPLFFHGSFNFHRLALMFEQLFNELRNASVYDGTL